MKSLRAIGTIAFMYSSLLPANEKETKGYASLPSSEEEARDCADFTSEELSLPELLSYVEDTVWQLINSDAETCQLTYHELKESLKIVYALNYLHPEEASGILQLLDECYANLAEAINRNLDSGNVLKQSLSLFTSGRNYEHESLCAQSWQDWTDTAPSNELKSVIESTDADLVYIQDNTMWIAQENIPRIAVHTRSRLLYRTQPLEHTAPKILIIKDKSDNSPEYKVEGGYRWKLGGRDHGKSSSYFEGEVKDKDGNYAKGKISKEKDDDGYDCEVKAGKEKKK